MAAAAIINGISTFIVIYTWLILIRVLLSWFPNINWYDQPFAALNQITEPYLSLFRSLIPPMGGFDISPMIAIVLLQVLNQQLLPVLGRTLIGLQMQFIG
ncbi:MAG: YggT family protein [Synechococcales bacterium]|nr:YggT family protein [Synechococcales bacterium]